MIKSNMMHSVDIFSLFAYKPEKIPAKKNRPSFTVPNFGASCEGPKSEFLHFFQLLIYYLSKFYLIYSFTFVKL